MKLMPGWEQPLADAISAEKEAAHSSKLPRNPDFYRRKTTFIDTPEGVVDMLGFAGELRLSHIGVDTEFRFHRPGYQLKGKTLIHDVRSTVPLLMSVTLAAPEDGKQAFYSFVIDLRNQDIANTLAPLFRLPTCFVGHFLQAEWFCLWQLGIEPPRQCWDTLIAEKARYLGIDHKSYKMRPGANELEEIEAKEAAEDTNSYRMDLVTCCLRYGISYRLAGDKKRLQQSFLEHEAEQAYSREQIDYAAEDAIAAAALYFPQVLAATQHGILNHLIRIEMPWVTTNARMTWTGLCVDGKKGGSIKGAAQKHTPRLRELLRAQGLENPRSHPQLVAFFDDLGLLMHFERRGKYSFDKDALKDNRDIHPTVQTLRELRKAEEWKNAQLLNPALLGCDGRFHPDHRQLGASTGRQTCKNPNVLGLSRIERNLITPTPGFGIGEVDLSQIEPGIAGAVYNDHHLIDLFNSGDVYSAMAQIVYADELDETARQLNTNAFKQAYGHLRKPMKACTLGIIYGLSTQGLAKQLKIAESEAARLMERFKGMFPDLLANQEAQIVSGQLLGYVSTSTGLRRHRGRTGRLTPEERNWMINHPVQGTAAALFKEAGNRLDTLLQPFGARLINAIHDSYVFEAPLEHMTTVGQLVSDTLCQVVQEHFPELRPSADINIEHPECWNKDGRHDALEQWVSEVFEP